MASTKRQVNKGTSDPSAQLADVAVYVDGGGNDVAASAVAYVGNDGTTPQQVTPATPMPIEETKGADHRHVQKRGGGVDQSQRGRSAH